ncbi:hypothetical protein [Kribbella italica]|uniref:DNA methylase N-4/N-6 domain-containing protein n=1 Tax=Kribbella italica TaxID=1540520 RepID=A0A7W9JD75_9ACTN|nr:hypothetical protein [Kribbella italica]MBB5839545.1 hypothetical protein [Kribbella italica]
MTVTAQQTLAHHYRALEERWLVSDRSGDYSRLVVPQGNLDEPFHRWFHLKEAYSSQLLSRLLKDAGASTDSTVSVLDPFVGSGTTVLSAISLANQFDVEVTATGIERNPLIYTIAAAKTAAIVRGMTLADSVRKGALAAEKRYKKLLSKPSDLTTPSVTLNNTAYFPTENRVRLIALARAIDAESDKDVRNILRVALAGAVEPAGRMRRDGRALRFMPERKPLDPKKTFDQLVGDCLTDLRARAPMGSGVAANVVHADGRAPDMHVSPSSIDWTVFSPPYPNNIDYTEVYKTEAWALGLYASTSHMRDQRLSTVRSHPSVQFPEVYAYRNSAAAKRIGEIVSPVLDAVPPGRYEKGRRQVIEGYADDMFAVLSSCRHLTKETGRLAFVVGNSAHGTGSEKFVIAADLLMSALAELAGWTVEEIRIARWPRRRGDDHNLRESVVSLAPSADWSPVN